ncbi:DUF2303 family protein [Thiomicrorhabdus sp.]|uniref:DUF2303 family protein n=1 Tax=Thiomicrorhabdus sp. TaxID=2039724 RepID=UPI0029C8A39E|nr:DUF2303 family protein [Thiomicrorhabdus sp.]
MSLTKEAIQHLEDNGSTESVNQILVEVTNGVLAVPQSAKIEDVEKYLEAPRRFKGIYTTDQINEFVSYANAEVAQRTFINTEDPLRMGAVASFDIGNMLSPGHNDHRSNLILKAEAEYSEVLGIHQITLSQKAFAEWLEEHHANITPLAKESMIGAEPAKFDLAAAIVAVRNMEVKAQAEHASKIEDTSESQSVFSQVDMKSSKGMLPAYLDWTCVPYEGLIIPTEKDDFNQSYTFRIRVSVINSEKGISFSLKILNLTKHQKAIADAFKTQLKESLSTGKIYIGTFK